MALNDDQARPLPGHAGDPSPERPAGLLEKLVAAIRPEFRVGVLVTGPGDPVFGGSPCGVEGCGRAARLHGLCDGHYQRWHNQGRADLGEFAAATSARMRGNAPMMPCLAPGCGYGRNSTGLCVAHIRIWQSAGHPDLRRWLDALPLAGITAPHGLCRVPSCALWATARTPLCVSHAARWRTSGRPDVEVFAGAYDDTPLVQDHIDLLLLEPPLRMEMQYVLQQRRDEQQVRIQPRLIQHAIYVLARTGMGSLLEWPEDRWRDQILTGPGADQPARPFLTYARRQLEYLHSGAGWEIEYPRDVWRLRNLGLDGGSQANLRFGSIGQPWLKELAKRWTRWRLSSGLSINHACTGVTAITRFSQFLAQPGIAVQRLDQVDRKVLESYLAQLHAQMGATEHHKRLISLLGTFFTDIRRHRWDTSLPAGAVFFSEDFPQQPRRLPRALAEHVMAQVEDPGNLDRWDNPAYRLITVILMRCGLRITDAVRLAADCIAHDGDGSPYLRYYNHKMKREALVPIDAELEAGIGRQRLRHQGRWPDGTPVLFPRPTANLAGRKPLAGSTYRHALGQWLERCDVRDEHGQPAHLTPHQWRHIVSA